MLISEVNPVLGEKVAHASVSPHLYFLSNTHLYMGSSSVLVLVRGNQRSKLK